ncbi:MULTISPECIES: hypothetical protein [unclassified Microcoleus]|nr:MULTISPECIES: hypothetical protein [unclassified Microcoleus]
MNNWELGKIIRSRLGVVVFILVVSKLRSTAILVFQIKNLTGG